MSDSVSLPDCEVQIGGQRKTVDAGEVDDSVEVASEHSTVTVTPSSDEITLLVTGKHTTIRVPGKEEKINFYNAGKHNKVLFADELDVKTKQDTGSHNTIERTRALIEDFGNEDNGGDDGKTVIAEDLVEQTRSGALSEAGLFGSTTLEYQTVAEDADWCEGCGEDTDAIIYQHAEDVFLFFGFPVSSGDHNDWMECESCAVHIDPDDIELSEDERKDIYG